MLGLPPALGRDLVPDDDRRGAPLVALLSDGYWRRAFGARPDALGAHVVISGRPSIVVGVLPNRFRGLDLTDSPTCTGIAVVWAGVDVMRAFLFQIEPLDLLAIAGAAALLLVLVLVVSLKPARAAMRMDVARVLAEE